MDPNATYTKMVESFQNGEIGDAISYAHSLHGWLVMGGFYPTNVTRYDLRKTMANVLRCE